MYSILGLHPLTSDRVDGLHPHTLHLPQQVGAVLKDLFCKPRIVLSCCCCLVQACIITHANHVGNFLKMPAGLPSQRQLMKIPQVVGGRLDLLDLLAVPGPARARSPKWPGRYKGTPGAAHLRLGCSMRALLEDAFN